MKTDSSFSWLACCVIISTLIIILDGVAGFSSGAGRVLIASKILIASMLLYVIFAPLLAWRVSVSSLRLLRRQGPWRRHATLLLFLFLCGWAIMPSPRRVRFFKAVGARYQLAQLQVDCQQLISDSICIMERYRNFSSNQSIDKDVGLSIKLLEPVSLTVNSSPVLLLDIKTTSRPFDTGWIITPETNAASIRKYSCDAVRIHEHIYRY